MAHVTVFERVELNPKVCNGKPVIKGTRIPVTVILDQIADGESWESDLAGYPELTKEDIHAALLYARASLDHSELEH
ncbi:MAG TPA: antitoxin [Nitrospiraceae bacterium]|nr:antitoxin [Nitrospiraceae bacterium]